MFNRCGYFHFDGSYSLEKALKEIRETNKQSSQPKNQKDKKRF